MWYFHYWHLLKTNPKQTGHSGAHLQSRCLDGRSLVNLQPDLHSKFYPTQSNTRGLKIFFFFKKRMTHRDSTPSFSPASAEAPQKKSLRVCQLPKTSKSIHSLKERQSPWSRMSQVVWVPAVCWQPDSWGARDTFGLDSLPQESRFFSEARMTGSWWEPCFSS